jgi:hypothetical protein
MDITFITRFWLLLAGIGGAILPVALSNEPSHGRELMQVGCGALMAIFLAPALERHFLPAAPSEITAGISFLTGCFGLKFASLAQKMLDRHGETLANHLVDRITGREGKQP